MTIHIGLVGLGHIAREAHLPAIAANPDLSLSAVASRGSRRDDVASFADIESMLAGAAPIDAVSLCGPPQVRYRQARAALAAGKHVMQEKPPAATLAEIADLAETARRTGTTLFASWHSRAAPGVAPARDWLADKHVERVAIHWQEDVRQFHPGQDWIWQPGGLGVFDPGINALSIVTAVLAEPFAVVESNLSVPENTAAPIAAELRFGLRSGGEIAATFDWRHAGEPLWRIAVDTDGGRLELDAGGHALTIDGAPQTLASGGEYENLYARFAQLVSAGGSDVDAAPLTHVADAFLHARQSRVAAFYESG